MSMLDVLVSSSLILIGFLGLVGGGEILVRAAAALAAAMRISPLVVGLTVVAFGTSAPELAVTVQSVWADAADLAVGNVVGSNIANILLVLGVAALVSPLVVHERVRRIDLPLVILASAGVWLLALDRRIGHWDGLLLCLLLFGYLVWSVRQGRREALEPLVSAGGALDPPGAMVLLRELARLLVGLVLLAMGGRLLVMGAVDIARVLGVGELVVGLTLVAVGTSLPEVVTSVIAGLRGHRDIAVGNLIGSNLFNLLAVLGIGAATSPSGIPVLRAVLKLDLPIMILTTLACIPAFVAGRVGRRTGAVFLAYFICYLIYVVLRATQSPFRQTFEMGMLGVAFPLTLIAMTVAVYPLLRRRFSD
ncbi:calcium/sodium antiporter [Imhoffiella purpurea]|uniref:Inner membrane protein YrbG n=1 Tax=Imhoffiella purpurea TaxID=1249627 RepID=W9VXT0_9GAMM|nr:calcium/sodium antiporter [Imhoffiella purpurea]EXJ15225.1 Inner membrane protein YrbG [Imhoffiella purpurea]